MQLNTILFYWVGCDRFSRIRQGHVWADTRERVEERLRRALLIPLSVRISWYMSFFPLWWWRKLQTLQQVQQLSAEQLSLFFRSFYTLLKGGMSPYQALTILAHNKTDPVLKDALTRVVEQVGRGLLIGDAFRAASAWWPLTVIVAVTAAQTSGMLDRVSVYLADTYALQHQVRADMRTVLVVPLLTAGGALVLFGWVGHMCVSGMEGHEQGVFALIISVSDYVRAYGLWCAIGIVLFAHYIRLHIVHSLHSRIMHLYGLVMVYVPGVGAIIATGQSIFFFMITGVLIRAGVAIPDALAAVAAVHPSLYWRYVLQTMVTQLSRGVLLYDALQAAPRMCIPQSFIQMASPALTAGQFAGACEAMAELLRHERLRHMQRSIALLQPAFMIGIGIFVAYFISTVYESFSQSINSMNFM
jgi:type IV pilus assembly protein PilC